MAHTCPVCGITCHCNGDIDDICLDLEEDELGCNHCDEFEDPEDFEDYNECDYEFDCDTVEGGCGCCPYEVPICAGYFEEQEKPY